MGKEDKADYRAYISVDVKPNGFTNICVAGTSETKCLKLFRNVMKEVGKK